MIKLSMTALMIALITLCACRASKNALSHENKLMQNLLDRANHKPIMDGEGYFIYRTYGLEHTESYKELAISVDRLKATVHEIYSPKRGGIVSSSSREIDFAEVDALLNIIMSGGFWSVGTQFNQTSLGGGITVLGGWKAGINKMHLDIPPEAPLAKAEAWFERVSVKPTRDK